MIYFAVVAVVYSSGTGHGGALMLLLFVVVVFSTGIGRGGTFVVLSSVLEQLKVEGIIDPFFTIHSLRQQQPGLVTNFVSPALLVFISECSKYNRCCVIFYIP